MKFTMGRSRRGGARNPAPERTSRDDGEGGRGGNLWNGDSWDEVEEI